MNQLGVNISPGAFGHAQIRCVLFLLLFFSAPARWEVRRTSPGACGGADRPKSFRQAKSRAAEREKEEAMAMKAPACCGPRATLSGGRRGVQPQ